MASLADSVDSQQVTIVTGAVTIVAGLVTIVAGAESATSTLVSLSPAYEDTHTRKAKRARKTFFISLETPVDFLWANHSTTLVIIARHFGFAKLLDFS